MFPEEVTQSGSGATGWRLMGETTRKEERAGGVRGVNWSGGEADRDDGDDGVRDNKGVGARNSAVGSVGRRGGDGGGGVCAR